jgi:ACS family glucarate transporter-like MFS transporter
MLLTWLPSYLQQAKGLCVLDAGMITAVPLAAASVLGICLGKLSDLLPNPTTVNEGRRRVMIAVLLIGASSLMIIPRISQLWLIILPLAEMRAFGAAGSALNLALVTDLVRNRGDFGKVMPLTGAVATLTMTRKPIIPGRLASVTSGVS